MLEPTLDINPALIELNPNPENEIVITDPKLSTHDKDDEFHHSNDPEPNNPTKKTTEQPKPFISDDPDWKFDKPNDATDLDSLNIW